MRVERQGPKRWPSLVFCDHHVLHGNQPFRNQTIRNKTNMATLQDTEILESWSQEDHKDESHIAQQITHAGSQTGPGLCFGRCRGKCSPFWEVHSSQVWCGIPLKKSTFFHFRYAWRVPCSDRHCVVDGTTAQRLHSSKQILTVC